MTVQVTTTPPGSSESLESGGVIVVPASGIVVYTLQDILPDGSLGAIYSPSDLVTEVVGDDLVVTMPDGTVIIFENMMVAAMDAADALGVAPGTGIEGELEPAAGGPGGPGGVADDGGSSEAASAFFDDGFGTPFGISPTGDFVSLPFPPFELPEFTDPLFDGDPPFAGLQLLVLDPRKDMVLEDKTLGLRLPEEFGPGGIVISGLPEGSTVMFGDDIVVVGPSGVAAGNPADGLNIIPPLHDDKNFTVQVSQQDGDTVISVEIHIQVKAVADPAKILLDRPGKPDVDIGDSEYLGGKNPVQWEMEPYLCAGHNDTPHMAMDLGALDGTNGIALTVNGWLATAEFDDVDVYKFTITQKGKYDIDIDFGDLKGRRGPIKSNAHMGRVDDADAALLLFRVDEDGNVVLVAFDDNSGAGKDPLINGKFLKEGMYFVAVTQSENVDLEYIRWHFEDSNGEEPLTFQDIFGEPNGEHHGNRWDDGDYQLQIRPDRDHDDVTPGHMVNLMVVEDNPMKTFDGDFEFGEFSGWTTIGDARIIGDNQQDAPSGEHQVALTTRRGQGAVRKGEIGEFLDVDLEQIAEVNLDLARMIREGVEGSAMTGKFWLKEGQKVQFDWNFLTDETLRPDQIEELIDALEDESQNDFGFVVITDDLGNVVHAVSFVELFRIAANDLDGPLGPFFEHTGYGGNTNSSTLFPDEFIQPFMWESTGTGVFNFSIVLLDSGDRFFDSGLLIDNVSVDGWTPGMIKMLGVSGPNSGFGKKLTGDDPGHLYMVDQENGQATQIPTSDFVKEGLTGLAVNQANGVTHATSISGGEPNEPDTITRDSDGGGGGRGEGPRGSHLVQLDPHTGDVIGGPIGITEPGGEMVVIRFDEEGTRNIEEPWSYFESGYILTAKDTDRDDPEVPDDIDLRKEGVLKSSVLRMHPNEEIDLRQQDVEPSDPDPFAGNPSTKFSIVADDGKLFSLASFDIVDESLERGESLMVTALDAWGNELGSFTLDFSNKDGFDHIGTVALPTDFPKSAAEIVFEIKGKLEGNILSDFLDIDNIKIIENAIAISDLSYQPDTGVLYGAGSSADRKSGGKLFIIDTTTGIATLIGDLSETLDTPEKDFTIEAFSIAFDHESGELYAVVRNRTEEDEVESFFVKLNPNDGTPLADPVLITTQFDETPFNDFFDGLGVRPNDGVIFGTAGGKQFGEAIFKINPETGQAKFVGPNGAGQGDERLTLSDLDFFVKPQKYLDTENKHTIEGLDLMVRDPDGTESVTFVKIDINDIYGGDDLPPGFMIGFGEIHRDDDGGDPKIKNAGGDGWFYGERDNGNFFEDGENWVWINVTRIPDNNPDVGPEAAIQDTIKVRVHYDEDDGLVFFRIPDYLRVQNVDLGGLMWKAEKSNDQDFNIEVMVRTTETHHEFSVHPNRHFEDDEPELTIVDGQTVMTTIEVSGIPDGEILHDLNLLTKILDHGSTEDLIITLTSPEGTTVTLSSENDFRAFRTRWDDQENDPVTDDPGPDRSLTVESALAAFWGENPNGTWKISITDTSMEVIDFGAKAFTNDVYFEDGFRLNSLSGGKLVVDDHAGPLDDDGGNVELQMRLGDEAFEIVPQDPSKPFRLFQFDIEGELLDETQSIVVTAFDPNDPSTPIGSFTIDGFTVAVGANAGEENLGTVVVPDDFPTEVSRITFELVDSDGQGLGENIVIDNIKVAQSMPDGLLEEWALRLKTIPEDQLKLVMYGPFESGEVEKEISNQGGDGRDFEPTRDWLWVEGVKGPIKDVDLFTDITHDDSGSLVIELISPEYTRVLIVRGEASQEDLADIFAGTTWDDQVNTPVTDAVFVDGVLQPNLTPESAMAAFKGEDPNGYWGIKIRDLEKDVKDVLVFDNSSFVDTEGGEPGSAESDEIQDSLAALGHDVMTFTSLDATDIAEALEGKEVLLIPELENAGLAGELSEEALQVIRDFVEAGGKLVIHGQNSRASEFLNELFGYDLDENFDDEGSSLTGNEIGTFFEGGPTELGGQSAVSGLSNLPSNATSIYESEAGASTVTLFSEGAGHVVYLGWDWFQAEPFPGDADNGWIEVLDRTINMGQDGQGTLNDWSLKFTVVDGTELGVPHFYNSTTIMVNNKAVADKPMFGKLVVVDFGDGRPEILSGGEGPNPRVSGGEGPWGGGDVYEEDGMNLQVIKGPVILKDVLDDEWMGSRELGVSKGDVLKITADEGARFSFISFSVDKESFEGYQGESIKFFGFLDGELVGELELDGRIDEPETIILPSTFMDVDEIILKTDFNHYPDQGKRSDFAFLDDMKFKLPLMAVDVYEDNAMFINGSFEGKGMPGPAPKPGPNPNFGGKPSDVDPFAGWMKVGDVGLAGALKGYSPVKTIRFEGTESPNPSSYSEQGILFQDTGSQGFRLSTSGDNELLLIGGGGPDSFKMTAPGGGRFNLLEFTVENNNLDNKSDEFITFKAYRDGVEVDSHTVRRSDGTGVEQPDFYNVDEVRVRVSSGTDGDDYIKVDNMKVQFLTELSPTDGKSQAILTTGEWAKPDSEIEWEMGLPKGALDRLIRQHVREEGDGPGGPAPCGAENPCEPAPPRRDPADATEGSAIKVTLKLDAGDKVSFDWNMLTTETVPNETFHDFGFVFVLGPPRQGEAEGAVQHDHRSDRIHRRRIRRVRRLDRLRDLPVPGAQGRLLHLRHRRRRRRRHLLRFRLAGGQPLGQRLAGHARYADRYLQLLRRPDGHLGDRHGWLREPDLLRHQV